MTLNFPFVKPSQGFDLVRFTPELASEFLRKHNFGNRSIRPHVIKKYAKSMSDGDWVLSPEPLALSTDGRLLNGQHRLSAVIASGVTCDFYVAHGFDDHVFSVLDRGATRTSYDALKVDRRLAQTATVLAKVNLSQSPLTDGDIRKAIQIIRPTYEILTKYASSNAALFGSAPFRLAAVARVMGGASESQTFQLYADLVNGKVEDMPPVGHSAVRMYMNGSLVTKSSGGARQDYYLRIAWSIFNPMKKSAKIIRPQARETVFSEILKATGYEA